MQLRCADITLDLHQPHIMGILNTTPDSFSDGGSYYGSKGLDLSLAVARAKIMMEEGATIIDVGGESTRPGANPVTIEEELARVIPVVAAIKAQLSVVVSVDTSTPEVISAAAQAGAGMINDVRALTRPGAIEAAAKNELPICLMHMQGDPSSMQQNPDYSSVVTEVVAFLRERIDVCRRAGIEQKRLLIDPGFGFGKTMQHNLELLAHLRDFLSFDCPILVGLSRKSVLGHLLGRPVEERLAGSLALALLAAERGARIIRVHDVAATRDVLTVWQAIEDNARLL